MKTLNFKTILIAIALLTGFNSFAATNHSLGEIKNVQFSVDTYISKLKTGYSADLANILSDDVKFTITTNGRTFTHGKSEELAFMKQNKDAVQQCKIVSTVLASRENYNLVKVSMVFDTFTREDYVTLVKSKDHWEITDVSSEFK
jgi:hypothetical protein